MKRLIFLLIFLYVSSFIMAQKSLTLNDLEPGTLIKRITSSGLDSIINLKLHGIIDARDFKTMRDSMAFLKVVNLANVKINEYSGTEGTGNNWLTSYPANTIPQNAFENCLSLTSIEFPDSTTSIDFAAFQNCINLNALNIPNSVTSIGVSAFGGCNSLTSVAIPLAVNSIGVDAFFNC